FDCIEKELFRQYHIGSIRSAPSLVAARAHGREALIGRDDPGIHRTGLRALAIVFEKRGTRRRLESEVVHALPVAGENARGRIEVRQHASIHAGSEEISIGLHGRQTRDVVQTLRRESFRIAYAAAERDDDHAPPLAGTRRLSARQRSQHRRKYSWRDGEACEPQETTLSQRQRHQYSVISPPEILRLVLPPRSSG